MKVQITTSTGVVPVRLPVACVAIPQTSDSLAPRCVGEFSNEVVRLGVDKKQLTLKSFFPTQQILDNINTL